jgi:hypothetical protein
VVGWILAWAFATAIAGIAHMMVTLRIIDDLEQALPIERPPSWRFLQPRGGLPLRKLKAHAQKLPESKLRMFWWIATACLWALQFTGLTWVIIWNLRR